MANSFTNATGSATQAGTTIYTVPASTQGIIHALFMSNTSASTVTVTVTVGGNNVMYEAPIPPNSTLVPEKQINMTATQPLQVSCSADAAVDVFASILEVS